MKLRIRGNSIRLRLTQGEVTALGEGGRVEETTAFGPGESQRLRYAIVVDEARERVSAEIDGSLVTVRLPANAARRWVQSEDVSLEGEQPIGEGASLLILVEKDFACLAPRRGEDDADAFPNPKASC